MNPKTKELIVAWLFIILLVIALLFLITQTPCVTSCSNSFCERYINATTRWCLL